MRPAVLGTALLAVTLRAGLAGCGKGATATPPPTTAATTPDTSAPAVTTAPPTRVSARPTVTPAPSSTTPTATRTTAAAPARACASLAPALGSSRTSGGYTSLQLRLRNAGPVACTVSGWPDVDLAYSDGMQVGPSATHLAGKTAVVTLAVGASATATFRYVPASSDADCQADTADQLLVFPPGSGTSSTLTTHIAFCTAQADRPGVTAVTAS